MEPESTTLTLTVVVFYVNIINVCALAYALDLLSQLKGLIFVELLPGVRTVDSYFKDEGLFEVRVVVVEGNHDVNLPANYHLNTENHSNQERVLIEIKREVPNYPWGYRLSIGRGEVIVVTFEIADEFNDPDQINGLIVDWHNRIIKAAGRAIRQNGINPSPVV